MYVVVDTMYPCVRMCKIRTVCVALKIILGAPVINVEAKAFSSLIDELKTIF